MVCVRLIFFATQILEFGVVYCRMKLLAADNAPLRGIAWQGRSDSPLQLLSPGGRFFRDRCSLLSEPLGSGVACKGHFPPILR